MSNLLLVLSVFIFIKSFLVFAQLQSNVSSALFSQPPDSSSVNNLSGSDGPFVNGTVLEVQYFTGLTQYTIWFCSDITAPIRVLECTDTPIFTGPGPIISNQDMLSFNWTVNSYDLGTQGIFALCFSPTNSSNDCDEQTKSFALEFDPNTPEDNTATTTTSGTTSTNSVSSATTTAITPTTTAASRAKSTSNNNLVIELAIGLGLSIVILLVVLFFIRRLRKLKSNRSGPSTDRQAGILPQPYPQLNDKLSQPVYGELSGTSVGSKKQQNWFRFMQPKPTHRQSFQGYSSTAILPMKISQPAFGELSGTSVVPRRQQSWFGFMRLGPPYRQSFRGVSSTGAPLRISQPMCGELSGESKILGGTLCTFPLQRDDSDWKAKAVEMSAERSPYV